MNKNKTAHISVIFVTEDLPKSFYYGDKYHRYMGGLILVHSKEEYKELQRKKRLKKK
jgi:hypothetical protein